MVGPSALAVVADLVRPAVADDVVAELGLPEARRRARGARQSELGALQTGGADARLVAFRPALRGRPAHHLVVRRRWLLLPEIEGHAEAHRRVAERVADQLLLGVERAGR